MIVWIGIHEHGGLGGLTPPEHQNGGPPEKFWPPLSENPDPPLENVLFWEHSWPLQLGFLSLSIQSQGRVKMGTKKKFPAAAGALFCFPFYSASHLHICREIHAVLQPLPWNQITVHFLPWNWVCYWCDENGRSTAWISRHIDEMGLWQH